MKENPHLHTFYVYSPMPIRFPSDRKPVSDLDLQALADDELGPDERREIMKAVMESPSLLARLDALLSQKRLLQQFSPDSTH